MTDCAASPPPPSRFGMSIRHKSTTIETPPVDTENRDDCPLCQKYSQGPCGEIFKTWLHCTDQHRGMNPETNQERHLEKCSHLAAPLAECLEKHQDFYDNLNNIYNDDEEEEELMQEWMNVVKEVEESTCAQEFSPKLMPELQIRPSKSSQTGMAVFDVENNVTGKPLTLVYVKDTNTGELLAAGALEDLFEYKQQYGALRLHIPPTITSITAYALYDDVLYCTTRLVPKMNQNEPSK